MKIKELVSLNDDFADTLNDNDKHYYKTGYDTGFYEVIQFLNSSMTFKDHLKSTNQRCFDPSWILLLRVLGREIELEEEFDYEI